MVSRSRILTNEALCQRIQEERRAEDLQVLCTQNAALVQQIANRFRGLAEMDDLTQEGYVALLKAAEAWEPSRGATFSAFAYIAIKRHIQRYLAECGRPIRASEYRLHQIGRYNREVVGFYRDHGRTATPAEIGATLGLSPDQIEGIRSDAELLKIGSLDVTLPDDPDLTLIDAIAAPDDYVSEAIEKAENEAIARVLWPEVDRLDPQQAEVILRRYRRNESRKTTAEAMGMNVCQARKTELDALAKLRRSKRIRQLADDFIGDRVYHRTGLSYFQRTNTSEPEWIIQHLEEKGLLW